MVVRNEQTPGQHPVFTAREVSLAREIRRDAISMLGHTAQFEELDKDIQAGLTANKKVSALISLGHVLGTITSIETEFLREHIAERLSKQLEKEVKEGTFTDYGRLRSIDEMRDAERLLRTQCENPISQLEEESVLSGGSLDNKMDESAIALLSKMNGEGIIDAYDFVLGENNWIWDMIEESRKDNNN